MPTFLIIRDNQALKVLNGSIVWVDDAQKANIYTSKYQAKRHLKELDNMPDDVRIVEVLTAKDLINALL